MPTAPQPTPDRPVRRILLLPSAVAAFVLGAPVALATTIRDSAFAPLGNTSLQTIIGRLIRGALLYAGMIALVMFVYGGVMWMTSAGNQERISKAKSTLVWATLGLVILFGAYAIVSVIVQAVGQT